MLRQGLLSLSRSRRVKDLATRLPVTSGVVARYVPGERTADVVEATSALVANGLAVSIDYLGEDTLDEDRAEATVGAYLELLDALAASGFARHADVSVKLSAIGQALPDIGEKASLENARRIARAARAVGATVTLDMEDHTTTDRTLETLRELRKDYPETGAVVQAYLRRTEDDCRALAFEGSRVRLCKGAYDEPETVAFGDSHEVDRAYVRCLKVLMAGEGYPMVATHDPRLVKIAAALATRFGRAPGSYEFQMLYGIRSEEQKRLAASAEQVRVYIPYGTEWYGYLVRRLAERPANLTFFLRSLLSQR
ncbi:MAG TPA: proline dehydrogenase family protein [Marmoricola sp.]|nr:proline dehydrogenase family protein [Marmoricola sp.]